MLIFWVIIVVLIIVSVFLITLGVTEDDEDFLAFGAVIMFLILVIGFLILGNGMDFNERHISQIKPRHIEKSTEIKTTYHTKITFGNYKNTTTTNQDIYNTLIDSICLSRKVSNSAYGTDDTTYHISKCIDGYMEIKKEDVYNPKL